MLLFRYNSVILASISLLIDFSNCFYSTLNDDDLSEEFQSIISSSFIKFPNDTNNDEFPSHFELFFTSLSEIFDYKFKICDGLMNNPIYKDDIYVYGKSGYVYKYTETLNKNYQVYRDSNSSAVATLIKIDKLAKFGVETDYKYQVIVTIFDHPSGYEFIIYPAVVHEIESLDSKPIHKQVIVKRNKKRTNDLIDRIIDKNAINRINYSKKQKKTNILNKHKKASSNVLFVEVLVVADYGILELLNSLVEYVDKEGLLVYMKILYAHIINGVDQRFTNSFKDDDDIKIHIRLKNLLFEINQIDNSWSNLHKINHVSSALDIDPTLEAFQTFMLDTPFDFSYDIAVGFVSKDLKVKSNDSIGSSVIGAAYLKGICGKEKFLILENNNFDSILQLSHELGHQLGAQHDGIKRYGCTDSESDGYIMTPTMEQTIINHMNRYKFSDCSKKQMKAFLLQDGGSSNKLKCIQSIKTELDHGIYSLVPGKVWSLNEQCQILYGKTSRYCKNSNKTEQICNTIYCTSSDRKECVGYSGIGAADGSICGIDKMCFNGDCVYDDSQPAFEQCSSNNDELIYYKNFPIPISEHRISCETALDYLKFSPFDPVTLCKTNYKRFRQTCCNICKQLESISCKDSILHCPNFEKYCSSSKQLVMGIFVTNLCPKTCQTCKRKRLDCSWDNNLCQNGGTCINKSNTDDLISYKCKCLPGYHGKMCEKVYPCVLYPCSNMGTCTKMNSKFTCICPPHTTGIFCEKKL